MSDQPSPVCLVDGCSKRSRNPVSGGACPMHYYRMRRTGTYDPAPQRLPSVRRQTGWGGYYVTKDSSHILALANGDLYIHRAVLLEKIGYGPHRCTYCEAHINWRAGLQTDHVDRDRLNNDPDNLVPSCNACNTKRAKWRNQFAASSEIPAA